MVKDRDEVQSIQAFINVQGLSMTCEWTDSNPNMEDSDRSMDHWKCRIRRGRRSMTLVFSMGSGHYGSEPTLDQVLDCLASDSASVEQADFEEWCSELGYDPDSRKAERTYNVCKAQADKLKSLLGELAYEQLLYKTERL